MNAIYRTDSHMRLAWVQGNAGVAGLLRDLAVAVEPVEDEVIDLHFNIDDEGVVTVGAYLEREKS